MNLPVPLTSFIGREKEVAVIVRLLGKNRLVTLMGSGGVGKTRLAIESANKTLLKFKDGVWWIDLVGLADPTLVPQEVAKVLDVREIPSQPMLETLVKHLGSKHLLLVLDNCEHLISACAQLADRLLSGCKNLRILATSREALDILGETTLPVPSLSLPDMQDSFAVKALSKFESVRLFDERAVLVQPAFELSDQNAKAVVQICRRLSGMPLAIELTAARVKMMTVDEIAKRLDDRFDLLTSGNRAALPRHQTLRATIDWSYDLLTEPERILFRRLSVFAGGFTLEAAEAVCGHGELKRNNILDLLGRLIDKSLVTVAQASITGGTRFRLLETIREYTREKLEGIERTELHNQHLEFFVNLVEEAEPQLELAEQGVWLDRLETEIDNIRAAIDWGLASAQVAAVLRIVGGLRRFWLIRNHDYEAFERMKSILNRPDAAQPISARLKAMNAYFFMLWPQGTMMEAKTLIEEALALGEKLKDRWNTAFTLLWAGMIAAEEGDYPRAGSYMQQSHDKWREYGDPTYMAMSLVFLGEIAFFQNEYSRAQTLLEQAAPRFREVQDYPFLGMILRRLGQLAVYRNEPIKATTLIRESLIHNWNVHDYRGTGACLASLANLSSVQGQTERAIKLFGAVSGIIEFTRIPLLPFDQQEYERNLSKIKDRLDEKAFTKSWAKGKAMTFEEAVAFALEEK